MIKAFKEKQSQINTLSGDEGMEDSMPGGMSDQDDFDDSDFEYGPGNKEDDDERGEGVIDMPGRNRQ